MSKPSARCRLDLSRLDDRIVPSTVNAVTSARPFDFVATGSLTTADQPTAGGIALTDTTVNAVTLSGSINYGSDAIGRTGTVILTGSGTGSETPTTPGTNAGRGAYAQTVQGKWSFTDTNGTVATSSPLLGTSNWVAGANGNGSSAIGPAAVTGTFDVSTFKLQGGWSVPGTGSATSGTLTVTLANAVSQPTAFGFGQKAATLAADGTVDLTFDALVTGNLISAPTRTTAATDVTAEWVGNGQTQAVGMDLPVFWNTGKISATATGLTPPSWATTLAVHIDAAHKIAGADEAHSTWSIPLAGLTPTATSLPPVALLPGPVPPVATSPTPPAPSPFTPIPGAGIPYGPTQVTTSFSLTSGPNALVEWRNAANQVIGSASAFDGFSGPIALVTADVNNDGVPDAIVAAGAGGGPRIKVFDGKTGATINDFFAFDPQFRGGVNVAVANQTGSAPTAIIAGAGVGGGPDVRVFDALSGQLTNAFFAFDPSFRGGVNVASAALGNDGTTQIIAGAGTGGGPEVKVFDAASGTQQMSVFAAPPGWQDGVRVAVVPDTSGVKLITAASDGNAPLAAFHSQLASGGPLLVGTADPITLFPSR